jgi:hypothetical protein
MPPPDQAGTFTRWHSVAVTNLTWANNLILAVGVLAAGFLITLLLNLELDPADRWQVIAVLLFLTALLLVSLSIAVGIWLIVNRLRELRARMHLARTSEAGSDNREVERYRGLANRLGGRNWRLLWWQSTAFGLGVLIAVAGTALLTLHSLVSSGMTDTGCDI